LIFFVACIGGFVQLVSGGNNLVFNGRRFCLVDGGHVGSGFDFFDFFDFFALLAFGPLNDRLFSAPPLGESNAALIRFQSADPKL
jgi:hypothetical protein